MRDAVTASAGQTLARKPEHNTTGAWPVAGHKCELARPWGRTEMRPTEG